MTLWLQSLNLTYKITNPKRDLSNGWVFAEILNRYYPEGVEMYQFDNGFKLDCKTNKVGSAVESVACSPWNGRSVVCIVDVGIPLHGGGEHRKQRIQITGLHAC